MDKATIASRAQSAGGKIYKSYVKGIKLVRSESWICEDLSRHGIADYIFSHKGTIYIVEEHVVGDKRKSAKRSYSLRLATRDEIDRYNEEYGRFAASDCYCK